jgi:F-type H+-transporting ATPase subunit b
MLIAIAQAATEATEHAAHPPFYMSAEFWVAVGFVIFVVLVGRTAYRVVTVALDDRANKIKQQIDEAARLAEEAQQMLAAYERKRREAAEEADSLLDQARRQADLLEERAGQDLERALKRREELAMERIAQAEQTAVAEIRATAVEVAVEATRRLLTTGVSTKQANALIDDAIAELPKKLH